MNVCEAAKKVARANAMAAIVIVVSCTGRVEPDRTIDLGSNPPPSVDRPWGSVAYAAQSDASVKDTSEENPTPSMPENPSHISLRFPKAPQVLVTLLSQQAYPYPYTVVEEEDCTAVTLYLPQGIGMEIAVTSVDGEGRPLSEPVRLTVEPEAKLGTRKLSLDDTSGTVIHFSGGAQNALRLGECCLQGPVTEEFVGGAMREIMQGVFEAQEDGLCEVSWFGCDELYSFLDGPPILRTEPFIVSLRKGQKLGLYPVINPDVEAVNMNLRDPSCVSLPVEE